MPYSVHLYYRRWSQHSEYSGYEQVVKYLHYTSATSHKMPNSFILKYFEKKIKKYTGMVFYLGFSGELSAAMRVIKYPADIYHFLYADYELRFFSKTLLDASCQSNGVFPSLSFSV